MTDLISRQAAIDAMSDGIIREEESLVECPEECNAMIEWAVETLRKLPSAQPEHLDCGDCIENGGDYECDHVHCHKGKSGE